MAVQTEFTENCGGGTEELNYGLAELVYHISNSKSVFKGVRQGKQNKFNYFPAFQSALMCTE